MKTRSILCALQALGAALPLFMLSGPAQADRAPPGSVFCSDSDAADTSFNPSYVTCSAHYETGPAPQTTLVAPFAGYGDFDFLGQTRNDGTDAGPFEPFGPGLKFGTLTLDHKQKGSFVIALSSFGDYSLYLFDARKVAGDVMTIEFSTFGTTNELGGPFPLEYANLYALVPELESYALLLAGLVAVAFMWQRRKD